MYIVSKNRVIIRNIDVIVTLYGLNYTQFIVPCKLHACTQFLIKTNGLNVCAAKIITSNNIFGSNSKFNVII